MKSVIGKWGNSPAIRIPSALMKEAHLTLNQAVEIRVAGSQVIIEPVTEVEFSLAELLAGITVENSHAENDFGSDVGGEVF